MKLFAEFKILPVVFMAVCVCFISGCGNSAVMNQSTTNVQHITQGEFEAEVTRGTNAVVVDFYAPWCGPCRQLAPLLDTLAGSHAGKIKFVKINVDESPGVAQNFQVQSIPTLIFFKDGQVVGRVMGLLSEAELSAKLESFANGKSP